MRKTNMPIQDIFRARFLASAGAASFVMGMNPGPYNASQLIGKSFTVKDEDDALTTTVTFSASNFANPSKNATVAEIVTAINAATQPGGAACGVVASEVASGYTGRTYLKLSASAANKDIIIAKDTAAGSKDALPILGILPIYVYASEFTGLINLSQFFLDDQGCGAELSVPVVQAYEVSSNAWTLDVNAAVVWYDEKHTTPHRVSVDSDAATDCGVVIMFI